MTHDAAGLGLWLAPLPAAFTFSQARKLGTPIRSLYALRDAGLIESLGRGLYSRADADLADPTLLPAAIRAPRATLCLRSALARHGLIDDIPSTYDLALPRGTRLPALNEPISWHRFATDTFDLGRETLLLTDEIAIGIYNAERCIVDAFRLRRLEGPELGNEALRRWLTRRGSQPARLLDLAAAFPKAATPLRHSLEVLL
jgi:hypothetical protein